MRWERFFEDLEDQLDSEWEAERAALDAEAERVRLSRILLRERLVALGAGSSELSLEFGDGTVLTGRIDAVGADWAALASHTARPVTSLVPLTAVTGMALAHADVLASARHANAGSAIRQRMSFGFVLRDLARRRIPVTVQAGPRVYSGTIDRAGADHLDIALHDLGSPRRTDALLGHRLVSFAAVGWVRPDAPGFVA